MRVKNEDLLTTDGVSTQPSMATSFNLPPVWLGHIDNFSVQLIFTGAPIGTFTLQVSNDVGNLPNGTGIQSNQEGGITNWSTVADSAIAVNGAGDCFYNFRNSGFNWVRVVYTATSSTGTLTSARAYMKGI